MKTKNRFLCLLVLGLAAMAAEAATNQLQLTPVYINQLAEEMRTNHPALLASRARSEAAASGVRAVRTWEDPTVRVGAMAAERMMREEDGDLLYGVEQKLPLFGKAGAQRKMATTAHAVEIAREEAQFQTARSELAKALFRAALADEVIATGEQDLAWLETTIKVVEPAYQSGTAKLMDLLTLQNEQSKRAEQLKTQRELRAQTGLALNRRLNRELTSAWPGLQLPPIADEITYSSRLIDLALRNEPRLNTLREEIRAAASAVTVARKERLPDVSVGFENRNYAGNGDWRQSEFMVGLNIPLGGGKSRAAIRREEQKHAAAEFEARDFEQFVREEVHGLTLKISAARREALLYRDQIIPRSDQALASAKSMFESGGGALRDVLDARRMLLEGKLMHARAVTEQYEMLSELVLCCGLGDLEALQMINSPAEKSNGGTKP